MENLLLVGDVDHAVLSEIGSLRALLNERLPAPLPSGPLSSWRDVSRAVGVAESTIRAQRRRTRDQREPLFASPGEAREWYARVAVAPTHVGKPRKRKKKAGSGPDNTGVIDWSKIKV